MHHESPAALVRTRRRGPPGWKSRAAYIVDIAVGIQASAAGEDGNDGAPERHLVDRGLSIRSFLDDVALRRLVALLAAEAKHGRCTCGPGRPRTGGRRDLDADESQGGRLFRRGFEGRKSCSVRRDKRDVYCAQYTETIHAYSKQDRQRGIQKVTDTQRQTAARGGCLRIQGEALEGDKRRK